jgi:crotonobetainyl-CoA:carnitine CoA-transferase CaiB-like acyl-CoA transferase
MLLGDLGADVIKVEEPTRGDDTRQWGPPWVGDADDAMSAYFLCANRNKRSITLNLKSELGRQLALDLARQSQVIVENFKPGLMGSLRLGFQDMAALNPALVYCSITGFGQNGPYCDHPGYDFVTQGMSGFMAITGPETGEPYKVGVAVSDVFAGLFALSSILAALRLAEQTGQGQYLDVSLLDTSLAALVNVASSALVSGSAPERYGNAHANIVPYQTFHGSNGVFTLACGNDRQFAALCDLLGHPELAHDARFATNPARVEHRHVLIPLLQTHFSNRTAAEWVKKLLDAGIPAGLLYDVHTILNDPHVRARGLVKEVMLSDGSRTSVVGMPVAFSATPPEIRLPPPAHGAHTSEVLSSLLKLTEDDISALYAQGVV